MGPRLLRKLGVVVVTYASESSLSSCLEALPLDHLAGVVVVDNASPLDPALALPGHLLAHPRLRLLRQESNRGFAVAATQGAAALSGTRWVAFVNPDVCVDGVALARLVAHLESHPNCAVVGPRLVDVEGKPLSPSGDAARLSTELRYALPRRVAKWMPERRHTSAQVAGAVGYVEGACFAVRRSAWAEVGGFGDAGFLFFEEIRLAERMRRAGYGVEICSDAVATHFGGVSRTQLPLGGRDFYVHETVRFLGDYRGSKSARAYRLIAGAWWWLAERSDRLAPAEARRLRAALYLSPPPPTRPGHQVVLLVATEPLWPAASGAAKRLAALHSELAAATDLRTLLALRNPGPLQAPPGRVVWLTERSGSRVRSALALPRMLVTGRPLWGAFYRRRSARRTLRRALSLCDPKLVITHEVGGAELCHGLVPSAATVLDMHNAEDLLARDLARLSSPIGRLRLRADARRLARWSETALRGYALVSTVSEWDRDHLASLAGPVARVVLAPNGTCLAEPPRPDPAAKSLLFVGNLGYLPNRAAVAFCIDHLLPRLGPEVRLRVVGRGVCPSHPQVDRVGFVPDLLPEWRRATLLLAPLPVAGCSQLKIVESFAAGVPVIASSPAARGLDGARPGEHLLVADDPDSFLAAVKLLLNDAELRRRLAGAARKLAERRFDWHRCLTPLVQASIALAARETERGT
ncbi:MAG: glycosyltransferase [Mycobacteriales bacterium]